MLLTVIVAFSLHEKYLYSALFFPVCSRIWAEYGEIPRMSLYLVLMQENTDQNNSEYDNFYAVCLIH